MADIRNTFKAAGAKNTEELRRAVNNGFTDIAVQVNSALRNIDNGGTPGTPSANTVTTNTNQTITGNKTFTGNTTFNGNVDGIAFSEIDSRPTTISGYGITDALQLGTTATTALAGNTPLLQLGTTAGTALEGNTPLLQLGTTSTTALAGNTVVPDDLRLSGTDLELRSGGNTVGTAVDLSALGGSTVNNNGPFIRDEGGTVFTNRTNTIDFTGGGIEASTTDDGVNVTVNVPDIPTVDTTVTDGSTNAVSGNAVFDALANKQDTITSSNRINADLIANGTVSNTEFQTLDGVTSSIQTQLNNKVNSLEVPGGVSFTLGINQGTGGQSGLFTTSNDRVVFPIDNEVNAEAFFNSLPMSAIDALTSDVVVTFNGNSHTIPTGALVARNTTNTGTLGVNAVFFTFTGANTFFSGITAADREAGDDFSINANVQISGDITLTGGNNIDISGSGQEVTIDAVENYTLIQGTADTIPTVNQFGGKDIVYVYI